MQGKVFFKLMIIHVFDMEAKEIYFTKKIENFF